MNKAFMTGYYQGIIEVAPAALSAEKVERLAIAMTIQHLRLAGASVSTIHDFLILDIKANDRIVSQYINLSSDDLATIQAKIISSAF